MNREELHNFFKMLEAVLKGDKHPNKLQSTFNIDESGI
jgi:hypothetical protein